MDGPSRSGEICPPGVAKRTAGTGPAPANGLQSGSVYAQREGIVTRGVLLDVAALRGVPFLAPGEAVMAEDLSAAEEHSGTTVEPGNAVFLHVGLEGREAEQGIEDPSVRAGVDAICLPWLHDKQIAVFGPIGNTEGDSCTGRVAGGCRVPPTTRSNCFLSRPENRSALGRGQTKKGPCPGSWIRDKAPSMIVRRRPTLPQGPPCSTIGAERLSFRVRNVTGRFPFAITTETPRNTTSRARRHNGSLFQNYTVDANN
jgi:hypothetical protein